MEAHDLAKAFDERLLFDHVNFSYPLAKLSASSEETEPENDLFKMITGQESPSQGRLELGESVDIAYVDQLRDDLDPDATVQEEISGGEETLCWQPRGRAYSRLQQRQRTTTKSRHPLRRRT